jgi:Fur family transcriptional regulator, peroxide stress response regulator
VQATSEAIRDLFRERSLRHTRQREVVYAALAAMKTHPTADELYQRAVAHDTAGDHGGDADLSLATVYNTLDALCDAGLAHRLPSATGPCRFDADTSSHAHLLAADGSVTDLPEDLSRRLLDALPASALDDIASRMGVRVDRVNLQVVAKRV